MTDEKMATDEAPKRKVEDSWDEMAKRLKVQRPPKVQQSSAAAASTPTSVQVQPSAQAHAPTLTDAPTATNAAGTSANAQAQPGTADMDVGEVMQ